MTNSHPPTAATREWAPPSWTEPLEPTLVTSDPRAVVRFLHDTIRMTDAEIAEAIGVQADVTVRRWRSEDSGGVPRRTDRVDDLRAITGMLLNSRLLYPEEVGRFLRARNEHLGFRRPIALLGNGDFDLVREAAEQILAQLANRREADEPAPVLVGPGQLPRGMRRVERAESVGQQNAQCPFDPPPSSSS